MSFLFFHQHCLGLRAGGGLNVTKPGWISLSEIRLPTIHRQLSSHTYCCFGTKQLSSATSSVALAL